MRLNFTLFVSIMVWASCNCMDEKYLLSGNAKQFLAENAAKMQHVEPKTLRAAIVDVEALKVHFDGLTEDQELKILVRKIYQRQPDENDSIF